jgi:DNA-binding response OmpR family regulator
MRVLVVEDDRAVADLLRRTLQEASWAVDLVDNGPAGLAALQRDQYDLAVLDLGLPGMDGLEVCQRFRRSGGKTPILILTARQTLPERVTGLDAGADDYLAKPFAVEELLARLRALARRPQVALEPQLRFLDLVLDPATRTAARAGQRLRLTRREYALLEHLLRHPRRVQSRSQILAHVWDDNFDPVANVIEVLIARVRRKVDSSAAVPLIHTVRGAGYILTDTAPADAR